MARALSGRRSRSKGQRGELELVRLLSELTARDWVFVWPARLHCPDVPPHSCDFRDTLADSPLTWWRLVRKLP